MGKDSSCLGAKADAEDFSNRRQKRPSRILQFHAASSKSRKTRKMGCHFEGGSDHMYALSRHPPFANHKCLYFWATL